MQNVPKSVNMNVDTGEKTWLTPRYILDALGEFDTDPCVPDVMPWRTANTMYTKSQNGLVQPWHGRVWLNPPYGKDAIPFFDRMTTHAGGGIALVFARTDTHLWHDYIFTCASGILFLRGRIRFLDANGVEMQTATAPSALVSFGSKDADILKNCCLKGKFIERR